MHSFSPTKTAGLPFFAQKTLLEQIESSGGLDRFRNQDNKKDQLIRPLLDKFPNLLVILVIHDEDKQETL